MPRPGSLLSHLARWPAADNRPGIGCAGNIGQDVFATHPRSIGTFRSVRRAAEDGFAEPIGSTESFRPDSKRDHAGSDHDARDQE